MNKMSAERMQYMRCPYCGRPGGHNQPVSKKTGVFRVKQLYNNVLIFECQKCLKVCRKATVGSILLWRDMSATEKKAFQKGWSADYQSKLKKEEKNEKNI